VGPQGPPVGRHARVSGHPAHRPKTLTRVGEPLPVFR
jgi:hypothetical protein